MNRIPIRPMILRALLLVAVPCLGASILAGSSAWGAGILGAEASMARIRQVTAPVATPTVPAEDEAGRLKREIEDFTRLRSTLTPEEASERWLALFDRFWALPAAVLAQTGEYPMLAAGPARLEAAALMAAIPPPSAWDTLRRRIEARPPASGRPDAALRILAPLLTKDWPALDRAIEGLAADASLAGQRGGGMRWTIRELRSKRYARTPGKTGEPVIAAFSAYLDALRGERPEGRLVIQIPDLVGLAGAERAGTLIEEALGVPGLRLSVPGGGETLAVAKRMVAERSGALLEPQWELVTGPEDLDLYEAMAARFPEKRRGEDGVGEAFRGEGPERFMAGMPDPERRRARINAILGMVARKRVPEAVQRAEGLEIDDIESSEFESAWQAFDKGRNSTELTRFCADVLARRPELPLWGRCGVVVAAYGAPGDAEAMLAAASRTDMGFEARLGMRGRQVDLLLAMDRVEEAITALRQIIGTDTRELPAPAKVAVAQAIQRAAPRMARLGRLLNRPELVAEALTAFPAAAREAGTTPDRFFGLATESDSPVEVMVDALLENGEYAAAEGIVLASFEQLGNLPRAPGVPDPSIFLSGGLFVRSLARLVEIYDRAGRPADVLAMFESAPWWGASDLIALAEDNRGLGPAAARALLAAGRKGEAVIILRDHLLGHPEDDPAYRVLIEAEGASILPWLDELYARDRFEERPLIWKAELLRREKRLEEAEAAVRQALKVDPTDGEQKAGDRVQAYAVLAAILRDQGKIDDATFFERVVTSVRVAERGDDFTKAGLIRRSLGLYEEAAASFTDAYCVQWRLAERLMAVGDVEGARRHYESAFERMPEQFGQVASVCFGCEGVFTHAQSRSVAEQVLTRLAETQPAKPQVQFLLGQLRQAQGRRAEAYVHFRRAAEFDPDYLDAWEEAFDLRSAVSATQEEIDAMALRMARLDPLGRHASRGREDVLDLAGLWKVYEESSHLAVPVPSGLLPLKGSVSELQRLRASLGEFGGFLGNRDAAYRERRRVPVPGDAVSRNELVRKLVQLLTSAALGQE